MVVPFFRLSILPLFLVCAGLSHAQSSKSQSIPVDPEARERSVMVESFVSEKVWAWQRQLNLQDWKIKVVIARLSELKPKTVGNIHWDKDTSTATIRVLDPADYGMPLPEMLRDMEFTVVHELIHLSLSPVLSDLQRNDANRLEEEHAVNHVADALLRLARSR